MNVEAIVRIVREIALAHGGTVDTKELRKKLREHFPPAQKQADDRQLELSFQTPGGAA